MRFCRFANTRRFSLIFAALLALCYVVRTQSSFRRKFEYKLSFKGPHLVQRDGTIPFWEHFGSAIASEESVRITPSLRSKKGSVWSQNANPHEHWEVELVFRVAGRGRIGADGVAMWYTEKRAEEGPVFGSADNWKGLGVFFDSFDNDGLHNNPYISVMVNDGTQNYDHYSDGIRQQIGGCLKDYRNKPFPVRAKIEYYNRALTLSLTNGLNNNHNREDFELCVRAENIDLPRNGYFGVSAATGGLADDHDAFAFLTHSLTSSADVPDAGTDQLPEDERKKFEQEFDQYRQKLDQAKEEYKKEHPDKPGEFIEDEDKLFEAQELRELKMVLDGQSELHRVLRNLVTKLDEVVGRQERELSMLTMISQGQGYGQAQVPPADHKQLPPTSSIQRHEVDHLLNTQKDIVGTIRDVKTALFEVQNRMKSFSGGASGSGFDDQQFKDVKSSLTVVQSDLKNLLSKSMEVQRCPESGATNCVSTTALFILLAAQLLCIIGYLMYRSSREAAAKKFF